MEVSEGTAEHRGRDDLLEGRICVVTGAANGIGAAIASLFAAHRATVALLDIDEPAGQQVATQIEEQGGKAEFVQTDVRAPDEVQRARDLLLERHGGIDVLVNNVGHWVRVEAFEESLPDHWRQLYEVNLLQVFQVTHAFLPSMLSRGRGAVVNVSSNEGVRGYPADPVYSAFKAAVVQFTKSLGVSLAGQGVRVNGIAPDMTATIQSNFPKWDPPEYETMWPMWVPIGRMGEPMDQARVALFLASDMAGFLVGETILVDGGTTAAGGWYPTTHLPRKWTNRPLDA